MSFLSADAGPILPPEYAALITGPLEAKAVAFNESVTTRMGTTRQSMQFPILREDVAASWVAEGAEITPDDPVLDEITVTPAKVAGLTIISRELANDSSPDAMRMVGDSLSRSIIEQVDRAFLRRLPSPAPTGLPYETATSMVTAGSDDTERTATYAYALRFAISDVKSQGGAPTSLVMNPADVFALSTITESETSRRPLLEQTSTFDGLPVIQSAHVPAGRAWIMDASQVFTVMREGVEIAMSEHSHFTSDRISIRATLRVGFGFPYPKRLGVVALDGGDPTQPPAA